MYTTTYSDFYLTIAAKDEPIGCGYHYVVTSQSMAHTAFRTREAFIAWASVLGLDLDNLEPLHQTTRRQVFIKVPGSYRSTSWMDVEAFERITGQEVRTLSNAQHTLGKITVDPDGVRTLHYLNVNSPRRVFDYQESQALEDAGRWTTIEEA